MTDNQLRDLENRIEKLPERELLATLRAFRRAGISAKIIGKTLTALGVPYHALPTGPAIPYHLLKRLPLHTRNAIFEEETVTVMAKSPTTIQEQDKPNVYSLCLTDDDQFEPRTLAPFNALRELDIISYTGRNSYRLTPERTAELTRHAAQLTGLAGSFQDEQLRTIVRTLGQLRKLTNQEGHRLTPETALAVVQLPHLTHLRARDSGYGNHAPYLSQARNLTTLDIGRCNINDRELSDITQACPQLEELTIDFNTITYEGAEHFHKLQNLRMLDARFNNFGPNTINNLRKKFPEATIYA